MIKLRFDLGFFNLLAIGLVTLMTISPANATPEADGWTLLPEQDSRSQLAQVEVVIRSGALSDPAKLPGLAYFTGRALLRGTRTRPYRELTEAIESIGASVSVSADQTQTVIGGRVIARNLDRFLDILRDILSQPAFDSLEMSHLQTVIAGELRADLQEPRVLAARALVQKFFAGTSVANASHGTIESVSRIRSQDVDAFFKSRYVRENMVVAIVSPLPVDQAVAKLQSKLSSVARGSLDGPAMLAPTLRGRAAVIVERKGMATVPFFIAVPGVADSNPEVIALDVGNFVFGADFTSRLIQVLRAENGWTYGAYSGFNQLFGPKPEPGLFSLYSFPSVEYAAKAIPKALEMLSDYSQRGVTAEEFAGARDALSNSYAFEVDTAEKRLGLKLRELLSRRPYESPENYRQKLSSIELGRLNASIARHTPLADAVIAVVGDPAILKPVLAALPGVQTVEVLDVQP